MIKSKLTLLTHKAQPNKYWECTSVIQNVRVSLILGVTDSKKKRQTTECKTKHDPHPQPRMV